jgi:hypothetical protein
VGFCNVRGLHCPRQRERVKESKKTSEKIFSTTMYVEMSADIKDTCLLRLSTARSCALQLSCV